MLSKEITFCMSIMDSESSGESQCGMSLHGAVGVGNMILVLFDFVILESYSLGFHLRRKDLDKILSESLPAFLNIKYHYVRFLAWYSSEYGKN